MQHIGEGLAKPNLGDFVDRLRKRLPKLDEADETQIRTQMLDLWDAADCRDKCRGATTSPDAGVKATPGAECPRSR